MVMIELELCERSGQLPWECGLPACENGCTTKTITCTPVEIKFPDGKVPTRAGWISVDVALPGLGRIVLEYNPSGIVTQYGIVLDDACPDTLAAAYERQG